MREILTDLTNARSLEVLVVAHSYGGVPAAEAVTLAMTAKTRRSHGLKGGVIGMFFMNAYLIPAGKSIADWMENRLAPCAEIHVSEVKCHIVWRWLTGYPLM